MIVIITGQSEGTPYTWTITGPDWSTQPAE